MEPTTTMPSNPLPAPGANGDGRGRPNPIPQVFAVPINHTEYRKILTPGSTCNSCEERNKTCVQECKICGFTTCLQCHQERMYDHRHILNGLELDWSYGSLSCGVVKRPQSAKGPGELTAVFKRAPTAETANVGNITNSTGNLALREKFTASNTQPSNEPTEAAIAKEALRMMSAPVRDNGQPPPGNSQTECTLPSFRPQIRETRTVLPSMGSLSLEPQAPTFTSLGINNEIPINPNTGKADPFTLEPNEKNFIAMAKRHEEASRYFQRAAQEARMNRLSSQKRGSQPGQNPKPASTANGNPKRGKKRPRESDPQLVNSAGEPVPRKAAKPNPAGANESVSEAERTRKAQNKMSSEYILNDQSTDPARGVVPSRGVVPARSVVPARGAVPAGGTVPARGAATTGEAGPKTTGTSINAGASIHRGSGKLDWNEAALPGANKSTIIKLLVDGGRKTVENSRLPPSPERDLRPSPYVANVKAALMSDRWVKENTEAFEVQWKLVEHLLGVWDRVKASKRSKGLGVLEELESSMCIVSLRRDLVDAPIWAFWAFWLAGMRQALEAPTLN